MMAPVNQVGPGMPSTLSLYFAGKSGVNRPSSAERAVREHVVHEVNHARGVVIREVGLERVAVDLVDRRLSAPHVGKHGRERVADRAQDVSGVLGCELVAERLVLFPGGRGSS